MPSYSTTTAALALGVDRKQLENLLGRCRIPGTSRGRQGRARRLSANSLLAVAAVIRLQHTLGIPASRGVELLAEGLLARQKPEARNSAGVGRTRSGGAGDGDEPPAIDEPAAGGSLRRGPFLLLLDAAQLEHEVAHALAEALEISPRPRRGRPRGTARQPPGVKKKRHRGVRG